MRKRNKIIIWKKFCFNSESLLDWGRKVLLDDVSVYLPFERLQTWVVSYFSPLSIYLLTCCSISDSCTTVGCIFRLDMSCWKLIVVDKDDNQHTVSSSMWLYHWAINWHWVKRMVNRKLFKICVSFNMSRFVGKYWWATWQTGHEPASRSDYTLEEALWVMVSPT